MSKTRKITALLWCLCFVCFGLSFVQYHYGTIEKETISVQKKVNARLGLLDEFAKKALNTPSDQWVQLNLIPEDMVIYKYVSDTLNSWSNLFPIHNDYLHRQVPWHIFHDLSGTNPFNTPLAYLQERAEYVNLGNSWYVIRKYTEGESTVIAGILIKTEYLAENSILQNRVNRKLGLDRQYTTIPITIDDTHTVFTKKGEPLFSIIHDTFVATKAPFTFLRWASILLAGIALFMYHYHKRSATSLIITLISLVALRALAFLLSKVTFHYVDFFSPSLYADGALFDSLGVIIINHLFIFFDILAVFMLRLSIIKNIRHSHKLAKALKIAAILIYPLFIFLYIHFTLKSIILNSSIDLELYNIAGISVYSIVVFFTYALLFTALLLALQFVALTLNMKDRISILSTKGILVYLVMISLYSVFCIADYGFEKEYEQNRFISNKLGVDRDLELELHLRSIENFIQQDPIINFLINVPNSGELIKGRLEELYFWNIINKYDIRITVCKLHDLLKIDNYSHPVDCFTFFRKDIIEKYGIPLGTMSKFYSLNNNNSFINYFGQFQFFKNNEFYNLYIEIDSKKVNETLGYPSLMIDPRVANRKNLPDIYSFAKYYENKLVAYDGKFNYPLVNENEYRERYSHFRSDGYVHFVNRTSPDGFVIISRETRSSITYLVTFSYLFIFYSLILFTIFRFKRKSRKMEKKIPKNSFRKKITYLITTSLVVAIAFMCVGSIIFIIRVFEENSHTQMEEKLTSIHTSLSDLCKYAAGNSDITTPEMVEKIRDIAINTQVDINLFSTSGKLITTTRDEVFEQYLVSTRINPNAYKDIVLNNEKQVIEKEKIASLDYYSLYAPIFNINGKFIAILNIPYFLDISIVKKDATPIIATIINLFLLLILAAIFISRILSNSIAKPVILISKKMQELDISQKGDHIEYSGNDELGALVGAYNNMVDDLEESTHRLAESEREQAWKEMARHIAHEIKNPLTPMQLTIQHLVRLKQQGVPDWDEKFYAASNSLLEQINILSQTASEFSSFAKFYNEDDRIFDLITTIHDQLLFFDNRENIRFEFRTFLEMANVKAKKDQITRVLVNLISNAIQAIEGREDGGLIRVSLVENGRFYSVCIEDNGDGVSQENLPKLFKPNFTTKSSGTGLGLAICKNIIDQSGGQISYQKSELGGANFTFELPICQQG